MAKKLNWSDLQAAYEDGYDAGFNDSTDGKDFEPDFDSWVEDTFGEE